MRSRVYVTARCPSVCLSNHSTAVAAGLLLSAMRAEDIDQQRRTPSDNGAQQQMQQFYVDRLPS